MITIEMSFPAGRYHATPWDRHVNEGIAPWPPEPLRILRALVACWHLKVDHDRYPDELLSSLIDRLAEALPIYHLPRGTMSHTRHYMPVRSGSPTLVFDGFVALARNERLLVEWPADLSTEELALLDELVRKLSYLGRSESWVEASVVTRPSVPPEVMVSPRNERVVGAESVQMLAAMTPHAYDEWRSSFLSERIDAFGLKKGSKARRKVEGTIPARLVDLLRLDTADWQDAGWSHFPGTRFVSYSRPKEWNRVTRMPRRPAEHQFNLARFALSGRPLPRIEDAVQVGEAFRAAVMSQFRGEPVPSVLSGRSDTGTASDHDHAFFIPEDADGDGWIDHVIVYAAGGLERAGAALHDLWKVWIGMGRNEAVQRSPRRAGEWYVLLEDTATKDDLTGAIEFPLLSPSRRWISATPYLHPWHAKKRFGPAEQLEKEIGLRRPELPPLARPPERLAQIEIRGTSRLPLHFHRFRSKPGLPQPDKQGSFWRLEFTEPLAGPLAFGFGCHFGLGLFRVESEHDRASST